MKELESQDRWRERGCLSCVGGWLVKFRLWLPRLPRSGLRVVAAPKHRPHGGSLNATTTRQSNVHLYSQNILCYFLKRTSQMYTCCRFIATYVFMFLYQFIIHNSNPNSAVYSTTARKQWWLHRRVLHWPPRDYLQARATHIYISPQSRHQLILSFRLQICFSFRTFWHFDINGIFDAKLSVKLTFGKIAHTRQPANHMHLM